MQGTVLDTDAVVDLQLHTVLSDGAWTPEALIDYLVAQQFALAAITDHDRVDIAASLQEVANAKAFPLLVAVEMSAHWRDEPVDVLCYGFDPGKPALQSAADKLLRLQQENIRQTAERMHQQGNSLPVDEVSAILDKPPVQQPHALVDLTRRLGYGTADQTPGQLLVDAGLKLITSEIGEVVEAAHQSGGVCLIAHPGRGDGFLRFDPALLDELRAQVPLDGIEVYYPKHTPKQTALYRLYAEQHGLLVSAGSDSHSLDNPPIKYRASLCRKLLARLGTSVTEG